MLLVRCRIRLPGPVVGTDMTHSRLLSGVWARINASEAHKDVPSGPIWQEVAQAYEQYADHIFHRLAGQYRNASASDIKDAVQDAFLNYYRKLSARKVVQNPEKWLCAVASNTMRDFLHDERSLVYVDHDDERLTDIPDEAAAVDETVGRTLEERRYDATIARVDDLLTPFERRCFEARMANKTYREIAADEGRSIQGVADAIERARVAIRRYAFGHE